MIDYLTYDWKNATVNDYVNICYPLPNQDKNIHTADVETLVPILKELKPKVIVEIGAAFGTSSKLFAGIAKEFGGRLYSIEPCPEQAWFDNMNKYGLLTHAELIQKASPWVSWDENKKIDLLLIDGWHNYRSVFVDYFYWQKFVKENGLIVFHDTQQYSAVKQAINEILKTEFLQFVCESQSRVGMEIYRKVSDKRGSTVFFGPWVGEFGWEVAWWQGWCRKISRAYDYTIVSSYPSHEGLYADFMNEFVSHNLRGQPMCGFMNGITGNFDYPNVTRVYAPPAKKFVPKEDQEFVEFGKSNKNSKYDVLIGVSGHRNKQYLYWNEIINFLKDKKVACFGKTGEYPDGYLEGTDDIRDISVKELTEYMAGCKVVIGPCTGAMHLASFCKANIVVWCDKSTYTFGQTLRQRFEDILNPFNNRVSVIDEYAYDPPVDVVINEIARFL